MSTADLIQKYHNPDLVKPNESPNGNRQILLFNDGEIVDTKGGSAFLQRSFFTIENKLNVNYKMPVKHGDYSFAILPSEEIARKIRDTLK